MRDSLLKVCIIGAGMISQNAHIPAYQRLNDLAELTAIYAPDNAKGKVVSERFDIPQAYSDVAEMLQTEKPELVSICVPNQLHEKMIDIALDNGSNVICEKPLALSYEATERLFNKAKQSGLTLCACQNQRFTPEYLELKSCIEAGQFGTIYYGEFSWIRSRGVPSWGHFCSKAINGGGAFADIAVHPLDLTLWFMGSPKVLSVSGFSSDLILHSDEYSDRKADVEEFASGRINLEGNKSISFRAAWCANLLDERKITLLGDKQGAVLPNCKIFECGNNGVYDRPLGIPVEETEFPDLQFPSHCRLIRNVIGHITKGEELLIKPEESINVALALEKFYTSLTDNADIM